jgi:hypothetical protein
MLPDMRLEGGTGDEVDRTAHRRPRRVLEGEERREPNRPLELDEHVDIAVGRGIAARDRAEYAQRADRPATPEIGQRGTQRRQHLLAVGHADISITVSVPRPLGRASALALTLPPNAVVAGTKPGHDEAGKRNQV